MLIRVRLPSGGTLKLRVEASLPYSDLLRQVAAEASLPAEGLQLSLNKREALPELPAASIGSLGIAGGDLIYLLGAPSLAGAAAAAVPSSSSATSGLAAPAVSASPLPPGYVAPSPAAASARPSPGAAAAAAAEARAAGGAVAMQVDISDSSLDQLVGMGFERARASAALQRANGVLGVALDLLTNATTSGAAAPPLAASSASASASSSSALADARGQALAASLPPKPPVPTSLVPQAWLTALDALLADGGASCAAEAVCLQLHLQLTQAGFVLRATSGGNVPAEAATAAAVGGGAASAAGGGTPSAAPLVPRMPEGWRQTPGLYSFGYAHARLPAAAPPTLTVKAVPMGPLLMVHGLVDGSALTGAAMPSPAVLSAQLPLSEFAKHREVDKPVGSASGGLSSLPKLVHMLSTRLVQPACEAHRPLIAVALGHAGGGGANAAAGGGRPTCFDDLLPELRFTVLAHLDVRRWAARWRSARRWWAWPATTCCGRGCTRPPSGRRRGASTPTSARAHVGPAGPAGRAGRAGRAGHPAGRLAAAASRAVRAPGGCRERWRPFDGAWRRTSAPRRRSGGSAR